LYKNRKETTIYMRRNNTKTQNGKYKAKHTKQENKCKMNNKNIK
jgi:hypothetical protein